MFLCPKYLPYSIEVLFDIYQEYVQQIQGYQWWIYRQDIERYRWTCLWGQTFWISRIMGFHDVTVKFPWRHARRIYGFSRKYETIDPSKQPMRFPQFYLQYDNSNWISKWISNINKWISIINKWISNISKYPVLSTLACQRNLWQHCDVQAWRRRMTYGRARNARVLSGTRPTPGQFVNHPTYGPLYGTIGFELTI